MRTTGRFAVVIVNYNTRGDLKRCLDSIRDEGADEVIVIDNGSTDESVALVDSRYSWVRLIESDNVGYGAAANIAIRSCAAEYVLLLNSDTRVQPGSLHRLTCYLDEHPRAAVVGPRLLNPDGSLQVSCFPFLTPLQILIQETSLAPMIWRPRLLRRYYLPAWAHDRPRVVPWVLGAALALRRAPFQAVGGFDESYFMYSEEVDLCYRLRQCGWETHFTPDAEIVHVGEASSSHYRSAMLLQLHLSRKRFVAYHYSRMQLQLMRGVGSYLMLRNILRDVLRRRGKDAAARRELDDDLRAWRDTLVMYWRGIDGDH